MKDVGPDTIDCGFVEGVSVSKNGDELDFVVALHDGQGQNCDAFLEWGDSALTADGAISRDLIEALINASADELRYLEEM